ncbi:nucleotidyltransferase family protein [Falsiroseomonas sp.]|uniref:nucleotidyltransferase family protein n=1 Tax=Falsiroseomonas sp. TaxID=2870721 RepID=UPI0027348F50|nr:nucleotidyltransferase family protein [Falsiroseomonas sp.]MDP3417731.1 nucleotidyltransferase family protein [Falsiroseomonas sp.]
MRGAPARMMPGGRLVAQARANPVNAALLELLPALGLNQGFLTAGCLFQEVWNHRAGHKPGWGIRDYDVFYFDDSDLSFEAEDAVIRRVRQATAHLAVEVEVRNQARVHLWYPQRFGPGYPQLRSAQDGIDRYLVACTCIGIELATGALYAPNGLAELEAGTLRRNPLNDRPALFRRKAEAYQARWPYLTIMEG